MNKKTKTIVAISTLIFGYLFFGPGAVLLLGVLMLVIM